MKFTPSSTARCSTRRAACGSLGSPHTCGPVTRIAPKPRRLTRRSPPIVMVPAAAALTADRSFMAFSSGPVGAVPRQTRDQLPQVAFADRFDLLRHWKGHEVEIALAGGAQLADHFLVALDARGHHDHH